MTEIVVRMVGLYWHSWASEAVGLVLANEMGAQVLCVFQAKHWVVGAARSRALSLFPLAVTDDMVLLCRRGPWG